MEMVLSHAPVQKVFGDLLSQFEEYGAQERLFTGWEWALNFIASQVLFLFVRTETWPSELQQASFRPRSAGAHSMQFTMGGLIWGVNKGVWREFG